MGIPAEHTSYQQVKNLIKQFTGQANTLIIPRVFIEFTGDHLAALLLSQVLYWSDRTDDPDGWFYKTADEWEEELGMSAFQVKRASGILERLGIDTKLRKVKGAPRMHYRIRYTDFIDLFLKFLDNQESGKSTSLKVKKVENGLSRNLEMDYQESSKSYIGTETTSETTTEITSPPSAQEQAKQADGDGGEYPNRNKKQKPLRQPKEVPRHVEYLSSKGVGAAKMFTACDPEATIALYDLMHAENWGNGAIVDNWKLSPPTPERVKQFKESTHGTDQPRRPASEGTRTRPPRPGERGYTGRT